MLRMPIKRCDVQSRIVFLLGLSLLAQLGAGCELYSLFSAWSGGAFSPQIVGLGDNEVFIKSSKAVSPWASQGRVNIYAFDLVSLEPQAITEVLTAGSPFLDVLANDRWVVWLDRDRDAVLAQERETGDVAVWLDGLVSGWPRFDLRGFAGSRLVIHRGQGAFGEPHEFLLLDLVSGRQQVIEHSWVYGTWAANDSVFAFMDDLPTDSEVSGELGRLDTNIQVVDLTTDDQRVVASSILVRGNGGSLHTSGTRVLWEEFKGETLNTRLRSYDSQTGEVATLREDFSRNPDDKRRLEDVVDDRMLVLVENGRKRSLVIQTFGGQATTVSQFAELGSPRQPRFVGQYVVWIDAISNELWVYDGETGSIRRRAPV